MQTHSGRRAALLAATAFVVACGPLNDLPSPPAIDTHRYPAAIRAQFDEAWKAVQAKPHQARRNGELAMLLHTYDQLVNASAFYERAAVLDDDDFRWPYLNAIVHTDLGNDEQALAYLRVALSIDEDYARARILEAELLLALGRLEECRAVLETLRQDYPERPEAYFVTGQLETRVGNPQAAVTALQVVYERSGDFGALHYALAQAYRQLGDDANAARHTALYQQHAQTRVGIDDPVLAQVEVLNRSETRRVEMARRLAARNQTDQARALLTQVLDDRPDSFAAHMSLVGLLATQGQFAQADVHLQRAAEIEPGHPQLFYNTGIARLAERRLVEADEAFRQCLENDPTRSDAHAQLGLVDELRERGKDARAHYLDALEIDPWHRLANWRLGSGYLEAGEPAQAIEHLQRVRSVRDPLSPAILVALARAWEQTGQPEAAIDAAREALAVAQQFEDGAHGATARVLLRRLQQDRGADRS